MSSAVRVRNGYGYKDVIADTSANTGEWVVIQAMSDTTFTTLTGDISAAPSTLPAGSILEGNFTAITLATGEVVAYQKP